METSTTLPRKYFVVVTHSTTSQRELENLLSSERFNSFGTSQAQMFVEGVASPSSTPMVMEFTYPSVSRKNVARSIEHDTQRILATLESEWLAAQSTNPFQSIPVITGESQTPVAIEADMPASETWHLDDDQGALVKDDVEISLTGLETALVRKMLNHEERVVSRDDLILSIGREPEQYRGLEMCLSRLQDKFKSASNGERLFRAVRNRGYCLIQEIVA
ncbi:winged helix-turn-helix domain-containing protein [Pseudomonas sp. TH08]|uniref:winged helix-turn-helix domain-containing protein n=1 Tax=unclassified Pseudomonas TaxID=196821 RepID=UPI001912B12F|nr:MULTISPECIES: helix-turn-helix domain-containing protein [unclassified Pseudomonas]MBK5374278.1 winged helix-turn-helix domain-containing protein [Pseudomonas sp. TH43]MBK5512980.1 winged helix-turn-helix domain-containing protein [Pseudomonas sp. TH15]MBK5534248.1 winged helix-turn-helix domain-containing protein [Pseudomonas sp. TH08]